MPLFQPVSRSQRHGFQLLELVVSLTASSLLIGGVATSVFLATRGRDLATDMQAATSRTQAGISRLHSDLAEAKSVLVDSDTSATMTVADRDGDGSDETLQYSWGGAGTPLKYSDQAGQWYDLTDDLSHFDLNWYETPPQGVSSSQSFDPPDQFVFQSSTYNTAASGTELTMGVPGTYLAGDLLVAAVAVKGFQSGTIVAPAGWTKVLEVDRNPDVSMAVFYTINAPDSNVVLTWGVAGRSYGVLAQFSTPSADVSVDSFDASHDSSATATTPAITVSNNNSLVIRLLATDQTFVRREATNMPGHVPIFFRTRFLSGPSIGMVAKSYPSSGAIPEADFGLTTSANFVSATIGFSP